MPINFKEIDAVLFDMDGTLVNTEPLHAEAMALVIKDMGMSFDIDLVEAIEKYAGMTDTMVLEILMPELSSQEIASLIAQKNQKLVTVFSQMDDKKLASSMTPGLLDFLEWLKHSGKMLAVVSASEDVVVEATLKAFSLHSHFQFWLGRNQTERTKPHPDPYLEAMRRMNVSESRTVIFEDSDNGMKAAVSSGAQSVRVAPFSSALGIKSFVDLIGKPF